MNLKLSTILARIGACDEARAWAKDQPNLQTAWANCPRSDWMIWLLSRTSMEQNDPRFRLMACDFAEAVLKFIPDDDDHPRKAIDAARRLASGEATEDERAAAWAAACYAASDAASDAARAAASDAARAAQAQVIRKYFPECPPIRNAAKDQQG